MAARFRACASLKNLNCTSSRYGSWLPALSTPTKYGLRFMTKIGSLMRLEETHAAMPGRSGLSRGFCFATNSSAQVLSFASATILSRSSFFAYEAWNRLRYFDGRKIGICRSPKSLVVSSRRKLVFGSLNFQVTVRSLIFWTATGVPSLFSIQPGIAGMRSLFSRTSLYQKMMSSVVNGEPSDHLVPLRSLTIQVRKSADEVTLSASFISMVAPSGPNRASTS